MAGRREQLRLFVTPKYEAEKNRAIAQGYSSPKSADRFAQTEFWREIRREAERSGLPASWLTRSGKVRIAAYKWWVEDGGDAKRNAYMRRPIETRSGIVRGKRAKPPMPGYRKPVKSAANETLKLVGLRTGSMRFAVGDTQAHLPSYLRQLKAAKIPPRKGKR